MINKALDLYFKTVLKLVKYQSTILILISRFKDHKTNVVPNVESINFMPFFLNAKVMRVTFKNISRVSKNSKILT